jgi:predicted amidohydrolase YtcJ
MEGTTKMRFEAIRRLLPALLLVAATTTMFACSGTQKAELVLRNGKVITVDSAHPEAQAVAMGGGKILGIGTNEEIGKYVGPETRVIDLEGRLAIPGFEEGHGHFMRVGQARMQLDLRIPKNWDGIVGMVSDAAKEAKPGDWISGRGWHQEKWDKAPAGAVQGFPTHQELSKVSPNNPVFLTHASGHAAFANAKALELAGINRETKNPEGGEIVRDKQGNPTGALLETAQRLVAAAKSRADSALGPELKGANDARAIQMASEEALAKGVTSFHDAGANFATIDLFRRSAEEGKLPIRLYAMVRGHTNEEMDSLLPKYRIIGEGDNHLTVRSIKRQIDGALGSRGAWLLEPYADLDTSSGFVLEPVADIARTAEIAIKHGFQLNTHAIGDRANREVLDIYEKVFKANPDKKDLRWRIEHAQHIDPADIPRFAQLGVIAAMQGVHATSDAPWVLIRLGADRAKSGAYMWHDLIRSGAVVTNGTDAPVEDVNPIASFYASVTRRIADGSVFYADQKMTREEALRSYTINVAYSAFQEDILGSLTVGKLADIVVLSDDIMTIPDNEIPATKVVYTIVGGKVVYQAPAAR